MDKIISETSSHLVQYLCHELIEIIYSYLIGFNTEVLISNNFITTCDNFVNFKINIYNNKIYLPILNGLIIIYDIKTNNTYYLNTNLNFVKSICNIDDNNIIVATLSGLYIYNYNIINGQINVNNIERKLPHKKIIDVYYSNNRIIFSDINHVYVYHLKNNFLFLFFFEFNFYRDSIFLYDEHLYVFFAEKYIINVLDINDRKNDKKILLSSDFFDKITLHDTNIFVNKIYIYIEFFNNIYVFNHDGGFVRKIIIDIPCLNPVFFIDGEKIYFTQKSNNLVNLLILQQKYKMFRNNPLKNWNF